VNKRKTNHSQRGMIGVIDITLVVLLVLVIGVGYYIVRNSQAGIRPSATTSTANIYYCESKDTNQTLDFYPAKNTASTQNPVVLWIHGGAWVSGNKTLTPGTTFRDYVDELNRRGVAVASINYRLGPAHKFPTQIQDVQCAVKFVKTNAAKMKIDPARVGAMGGSAGGHLAALLGTTNTGALFPVDGHYPAQNSTIKAVVALFPATDLYTSSLTSGSGSEDPSQAFPDASKATLDKYDPITYVTTGDVPTLIQHGDKDTNIPLARSQKFSDTLKSKHVTQQLQVVANGVHSFPPSRPTQPTHDQLVKQAADWFVTYLK
jgi:acetyl esterase/lipase